MTSVGRRAPRWGREPLDSIAVCSGYFERINRTHKRSEPSPDRDEHAMCSRHFRASFARHLITVSKRIRSLRVRQPRVQLVPRFLRRGFAARRAAERSFCLCVFTSHLLTCRCTLAP